MSHGDVLVIHSALISWLIWSFDHQTFFMSTITQSSINICAQSFMHKCFSCRSAAFSRHSFTPQALSQGAIAKQLQNVMLSIRQMFPLNSHHFAFVLWFICAIDCWSWFRTGATPSESTYTARVAMAKKADASRTCYFNENSHRVKTMQTQSAEAARNLQSEVHTPPHDG